jgi:hypothetical protein
LEVRGKMVLRCCGAAVLRSKEGAAKEVGGEREVGAAVLQSKDGATAKNTGKYSGLFLTLA